MNKFGKDNFVFQAAGELIIRGGQDPVVFFGYAGKAGGIFERNDDCFFSFAFFSYIVLSFF